MNSASKMSLLRRTGLLPALIGALAFPPVVALIPALASAAPKAKPKLAVLRLQVGAGIDPKTAEVLTDAFVAAAQERLMAPVITTRDIEAALGFEKQKAMLGCASDGSCIAEIGGALGVERVVTGSIAKLGDTVVMTAQVMEVRGAVVQSRYQGRFRNASPEDLLEAADQAAEKLFPDAPGGRAHAAHVAAMRDAGGLRIQAALSAQLDQAGGMAALGLGYRLRHIEASASGLFTGGIHPGAEVRLRWLMPRLAWTRPYLAAAGTSVFADETYVGATAAAGIELGSGATRFQVELPFTYVVAGPGDAKSWWLLGSLGLSFKPW